METAEIQRRWLTFFGDRGHTIVPSASLVSDDPTLMFTVAGMVPFIPYLTGVVPAPYPRATSVQKCIRTLDIEEVGKTTRHGTFFQMNGNFSFGDYFKKGAIEYAWELLTSPESAGGLGFREADLWVTVYEEDDVAEKLWRDIAGLPAERIQRMGREDNYWSTGQPGPAGPCSEIYFDRGPAYGPEGGPAVDDSRYIEIWNLVFMQYLIDNVRSKIEFDIVGDLPSQNIDTGMGMERVAFLKQGVENMYEIDQVRPVLDAASELSGRAYGANGEDDVRMRVIADHIRSSLMLMTDGVVPSNEGRGYVLRRLLRRSIRSMRLLGVEEATFPVLFSASRDAMAPAYPDVADEFSRVSGLVEAEEASFLQTLEAGTSILDIAVSETQSSGEKTLSGDTAFLLHDTYGFPIDLTLEMAEEAGLSVDRDSFGALMQRQRSRAKDDAKSKKSLRADLSVYSEFRQAGETAFCGYTVLDATSTILGLLVDGVSVPSASQGQIAEVILAETPLYAESGGQVADVGSLSGPSVRASVTDVQRPVPGLISHTVVVEEGTLSAGESVDVSVDRPTRYEGQRAHSATHLIHAALRDTLGPHATQAGSLNRPGYLRLDFSWNQALSKDAQDAIGEISQDTITQDLEVTTRILPVAEAKEQGAMALFGEKYGDLVRMVDIGGPWSRELCAGTHVARSSQIGVVTVLGESSVSSTARRIEALVGTAAVKDFSVEKSLMRKLTSLLKTPREDVPARVEELVSQVRDLERQVAKAQQDAAGAKIPELVASVTRGTISYVCADVGAGIAGDDVRSLVTGVLAGLGFSPAVVALGSVTDGRATVVVAANPGATALGAHAGEFVKVASGVMGGGGGGKPAIAQGGGPDGALLGEALAKLTAEVERL